MKLSDFATELKAKNNFIKASFGGFAGSGKTYTATQFIIGCYKLMKIKKPLLLIDNEKGGRFLIPTFNQAGIEVFQKQTVKLADVIQAMDYLNSGEIGFLFIDSLTKVWYDYIDDYKLAQAGLNKEGKPKKQFMYLQDWGNVLPAWQKEFANRFIELEGNCVFTGRGGNKYEMQEIEEGNQKKKQFVQSGVKMKMAGETPFEPDLNIWMSMEQDKPESGLSVWREAFIMKDRANLIDGQVFKNPTFENFKPVVEFIVNVPTGAVAGQTSEENLAPKEDNTYYQDKEARENELENIKNQFTLQKIGSSASDKAYKLNILTKFFGTNVWGEIEKQEYKQLRDSRIGLEEYFCEAFDKDDKEKFLSEYKPQRDLFGEKDNS